MTNGDRDWSERQRVALATVGIGNVLAACFAASGALGAFGAMLIPDDELRFHAARAVTPVIFAALAVAAPMLMTAAGFVLSDIKWHPGRVRTGLFLGAGGVVGPVIAGLAIWGHLGFSRVFTPIGVAHAAGTGVLLAGNALPLLLWRRELRPELGE